MLIATHGARDPVILCLKELCYIPSHTGDSSPCLKLHKAGWKNVLFPVVIFLVSKVNVESGALPGFRFFPGMVNLNIPRMQRTSATLLVIRVCISFCTRSEQCCLVLYAKAVLRLIWLCNHILKESTVFTMILGCKSNSQLSEQVKNAKTKEGQDFWNSVSIFSSGWTRCTSYNVMTSVIPFFLNWLSFLDIIEEPGFLTHIFDLNFHT